MLTLILTIMKHEQNHSVKIMAEQIESSDPHACTFQKSDTYRLNSYVHSRKRVDVFLCDDFTFMRKDI